MGAEIHPEIARDVGAARAGRRARSPDGRHRAGAGGADAALGRLGRLVGEGRKRCGCGLVGGCGLAALRRRRVRGGRRACKLQGRSLQPYITSALASLPEPTLVELRMALSVCAKCLSPQAHAPRAQLATRTPPGRTKAGDVHFFIRLVLSPAETTLRHVIRISDACRHLRRRCAPLQRGQTWADVF